jgi:hypothetical protein
MKEKYEELLQELTKIGSDKEKIIYLENCQKEETTETCELLAPKGVSFQQFVRLK